MHAVVHLFAVDAAFVFLWCTKHSIYYLISLSHHSCTAAEEGLCATVQNHASHHSTPARRRGDHTPKNDKPVKKLLPSTRRQKYVSFMVCSCVMELPPRQKTKKCVFHSSSFIKNKKHTSFIKNKKHTSSARVPNPVFLSFASFLKKKKNGFFGSKQRRKSTRSLRMMSSSPMCFTSEVRDVHKSTLMYVQPRERGERLHLHHLLLAHVFRGVVHLDKHPLDLGFVSSTGWKSACSLGRWVCGRVCGR